MIEGRSKPYQQITWRFVLFSVAKGYYANAQTLILTENTVHTFAVEMYLKAESLHNSHTVVSISGKALSRVCSPTTSLQFLCYSHYSRIVAPPVGQCMLLQYRS